MMATGANISLKIVDKLPNICSNRLQLFILKNPILLTENIEGNGCYIFKKGANIFVDFDHITKAVCEVDL